MVNLKLWLNVFYVLVKSAETPICLLQTCKWLSACTSLLDLEQPMGNMDDLESLGSAGTLSRKRNVSGKWLRACP